MSSQGLLGDLESLLAVLYATSLEELNYSLFVCWYSSNLADDLTDEANSLSEGSFRLGRTSPLGLLLSSLVFSDSVALVETSGDHRRMGFSHYIIMNILNWEYISMNESKQENFQRLVRKEQIRTFVDVLLHSIFLKISKTFLLLFSLLIFLIFWIFPFLKMVSDLLLVP
jgi:hypothetical protein